MNWGVLKLRNWILWSLVYLLGRIPFRLRSRLGTGIGFLAGLVPTKDRQIAELQIQCFLRPKNPSQLVRRVYAHLGQSFFEFINLRPLIDNPDKYIDFPSWPETERLLSEKRGMIALTAHLGNWEAMGAYLANKQVPFLAIGKQARKPSFHFVLLKLRDSFGFRTLWRANKKAVAEILSTLRSGQVVAALIDQDTRVSSIPIPFFGTPANTPATILELGKKANALFVTAFVIKKKSGRFEVVVKELPKNLSTQEILIEYNRRLEETIRAYPEQWAWVHKRWRTIASGERLGGKEYLKYLKDKEKIIRQESNANRSS